jgi:hypothetical protein
MHTRLLFHCTLGLLSMTFGFARVANAQDNGIEATGFFGYQLSPSFDATTATGVATTVRIDDSVTYGASVGKQLRPGVRSELSWRFQPTHLTSTPVAGSGTEVDLSVHHFHAVASYERGNERVQGFGLLGLGATLAHPNTSAYDDSWLVSFSFALGLKLRFSDRIGLRAESRLQVPFRFSGGGMFCGPAGCLVVLTDGKAIAQVDFVVGPVLSF